jgi:hypothetical protein
MAGWVWKGEAGYLTDQCEPRIGGVPKRVKTSVDHEKPVAAMVRHRGLFRSTC